MKSPDDDRVKRPNLDISAKKPIQKAVEDDEPLDYDEVAPRKTKKLGSLAQKARGNQLNQARGVLIAIGILTILGQLFQLVDFQNGFKFMSVREALLKEVNKNLQPGMVVIQAKFEPLVTLFTVVLAMFIGMGVLFLVFAAVIKKIPILATTASLVIYIIGNLITFLLNPALLTQGPPLVFAVRILVVLFFIKAIQAAFAYEKQRREEAEFQGEAFD